VKQRHNNKKATMLRVTLVAAVVLLILATSPFTTPSKVDASAMIPVFFHR